MATINLGAIKFNWRGAYAGGTAYTVDDVVSSGGSSYVCILASTGNATSNGTYWEQMSSAGTNGTDGTDVGTTITTQGDILYRDGSGLQRLAKGTAGQVLKINSGATAPEWGTDVGGKVLAVHFMSNNTRTSAVSGNNQTWLTVGTFTKVNASSDIYISGVVPEMGAASDAAGCWLQIDTTSDPGDNADVHKGIMRMPTEVSNHPGGIAYNMKFTGLNASTHTVYIGKNNTSNSSDGIGVINPNSSDEGRLQQTASQFTIFEITT